MSTVACTEVSENNFTTRN